MIHGGFVIKFIEAKQIMPSFIKQLDEIKMKLKIPHICETRTHINNQNKQKILLS